MSPFIYSCMIKSPDVANFYSVDEPLSSQQLPSHSLYFHSELRLLQTPPSSQTNQLGAPRYANQKAEDTCRYFLTDYN